MNAPRCSRPLDLQVLADYWQAELAPDQEAVIEEHLLGCPECSAQLQAVAQLAGGIRALARSGNLPLVLTPEFLDKLVQEGLRARIYAPPPGGSVQCTVTPQDDLLLGRLASSFAGVTRVDVLLCDASGGIRARLEDVPFRPGQRELIFNQPMAAARAMGHDVLVVKLLSVDAQGDHLMSEHTFHHSPTTT